MSKAKILIVEDQIVISTNVKLLLKFTNFDVTGVATTADEAFQMIEEVKPDLVLMDISLPGKLDGIDATKIIKERWDIPVIYLTARTDVETLQRAKETEAYGYLTKDIQLKEQLPILIEFVLYKHQMVKQQAEAQQLLKDSEEKFRSIASSASDAIIFIDNDSNISYCNEATTQIFGYAQEDMLNNKIYDLLAPDNFKAYFKKGFSDFRSNGKGEFIDRTIELKAKKRDGKVFPIEVSVSSFQLKKKWCACAIIRDVSERKETEEEREKLLEEIQFSHETLEQYANEVTKLNKELEESRKHLTELNASKDKFFSIIAHDLKNPFHGLLGYSEILSKNIEELSRKEIKEFATQLHESARHVFKLLENLLNWSRVQRGAMEFNKINFNLFQLVDLNIAIINPTAKQKKIEIINNVPPDIFIDADMNMTNTVLLNLISNSVKFTKESGWVKVDAVSLDSEFAEISVKDNGIGITSENLDKLFKIDSHISTEGTSKEKGTGLGLILCKDLIEMNGGKIKVESIVDKGSSFHFTLPLGTNNTN